MVRLRSLLSGLSLFGAICPDLVPAYLLASCRPFQSALATSLSARCLHLRQGSPAQQPSLTRTLGESAALPSHFHKFQIGNFPLGSRGRRGMSQQATGAGKEPSRAIEVEKKFMLAEGAQERVAAVLPFQGEVTIVDEYLDAADFRLTTSDFWLRVRDGQVELKEPIPVTGGSSASMDRYAELTEPMEILCALEPFFPPLFPAMSGMNSAELRDALSNQGCDPFCRIVSVRRKYGGGDGGISVDLDIISEPAHIQYNIGEVEVMVEDETGVPEAERMVEEFLAKHQLATTQVALGKVLTVIKESNKDHFEALKKHLGDKYPKLNKV